ncbi:hypothetical protein HGM15179_020651 [Zosterops borbonicus]|uniref:Uncharacterized protein n=1 Tax=Zosterops borbonicus TaxID=364589 RepID=A0A8K1FWV1_9PASS|nr:hypothetical protein HGM15179_020651 [Zosterops borbonicus]
MRAEMSKGADETPDPEVDPGVENPEWCGEWEDMGQILKEFSDLIAWDFPPEQIQNPAEVRKYLNDKCNYDSNEKKLIAICWTLVYAYRTLLDTVGQKIKARGQGDKSAATPVTQAAANIPVTQVVAKPVSLNQQLNQIVSLSHWQSLLQERSTNKTDRPVDNDDLGKGPSKPAPETDMKSEVTI